VKAWGQAGSCGTRALISERWRRDFGRRFKRQFAVGLVAPLVSGLTRRGIAGQTASVATAGANAGVDLRLARWRAIFGKLRDGKRVYGGRIDSDCFGSAAASETNSHEFADERGSNLPRSARGEISERRTARRAGIFASRRAVLAQRRAGRSSSGSESLKAMFGDSAGGNSAGNVVREDSAMRRRGRKDANLKNGCYVAIRKCICHRRS
jgi:hypothetical protein